MGDALTATDTIFARAYASAIHQKLGVNLGNNQVLFISPLVQRGIPAGDMIHPETTNYLIKKLGDSLLSAENPSYTGGNVGSYIKELRSYMLNVKLNRSVDQAVAVEMVNASRNLEDAIEGRHRAYMADKARFEEEREGPNSTFQDWAVENAFAFNAAKRTLNLVRGAYFAASQRHFGAGAGVIQPYLDKIADADGGAEGDRPGINMKGMLDDVNLLNNIASEAQSGRRLPADEINRATIRVPAYTIDGAYTATLQNWIAQAGQSRERTQTITLNIGHGRTTTWEEYGFNAVTGGGGFWPFFHVKVTTEQNRRILNTNGREEDITIELSMIGLQKFDVSPGEWDVPGVKTLFPHQIPGAPDVLSPSKARVISVLVGFDVALKVTFGAAMREEVNTMYNAVSGGNGELSILGFRVSAGAGAESQIRTNFNDTTWVNDTGTMTLAPSANQVFPTILGVVGQRL